MDFLGERLGPATGRIACNCPVPEVLTMVTSGLPMPITPSKLQKSFYSKFLLIEQARSLRIKRAVNSDGSIW